MRSFLRPAVVSLVLLTVITGVVYPLLVTAVARLAFADESTGSVIVRGGESVGSALIAQPFTDPGYFWPRPSAANYDAAAGSGSNLAPTSPALREAVRERIAALRAADPDDARAVPVDLVTASGSGLDPHISVAAAEFQTGRVAAARGLPEVDVRLLVSRATEARTLGVLGEPRVNVLALNLLLDQSAPHTAENPTSRGQGVVGSTAPDSPPGGR
ncbi:MAG: Potassium-transporting ATPase C chain [uncultured Phycisphaerae bacterium]|uniref:Potassium-transporting ATPase KdpC subunit n=1 Tax=uncultured Phycisphaerae bacterium TaxID=904963 RepID=A0A6J4N804_9BACT|nr:MAG: Potassium-transporting ATPase C chain [uncultured Phycisphaerae bacterium]